MSILSLAILSVNSKLGNSECQLWVSCRQRSTVTLNHTIKSEPSLIVWFLTETNLNFFRHGPGLALQMRQKMCYSFVNALYGPGYLPFIDHYMIFWCSLLIIYLFKLKKRQKLTSTFIYILLVWFVGYLENLRKRSSWIRAK